MHIGEIRELGYDIQMNVKDVTGVSHKYKIYPANRAGGINYFDNMVELKQWIEAVKLVRAMLADDDLTYNRMKLIRLAKSGVMSWYDAAYLSNDTEEQ